MTVIIYGLFYRVSAKQTHGSLKYGAMYTGFERARIHPRSTGKQNKTFFPATNPTNTSNIHP